MNKLYADEGFPNVVTELLRQFGHDVLTVQEAGQANQRIPDDQGKRICDDSGAGSADCESR